MDAELFMSSYNLKRTTNHHLPSAINRHCRCRDDITTSSASGERYNSTILSHGGNNLSMSTFLTLGNLTESLPKRRQLTIITLIFSALTVVLLIINYIIIIRAPFIYYDWDAREASSALGIVVRIPPPQIHLSSGDYLYKFKRSNAT